MADIFVSYTSSDRDWAFWIGQELERLGHVAHLHEWEIAAGGDISRWMEERHNGADHVLCVVSEAYLKASYSGWERRAALWAATTDRPNFALPIFIEPCQPLTLLAPFKRCDLHGLDEEQARGRLENFLRPAAKPTSPVQFPGTTHPTAASTLLRRGPISFPTKVGFVDPTKDTVPGLISNIPISVPRNFLGRDVDLTAIDAALRLGKGRVAVTSLYGLRGVGKTTLAAAFAERHRTKYRATWWIRAEIESTMRADLVGLGVRLNWIAPDEKEELAIAAVMQRLRNEGDDLLLIYDNARNAGEIRLYLPRSGTIHVIVTSNAPDWGGVAASVEIKVWPSDVGADYLVARTATNSERIAAVALSEALGGLPLAHEQAAAYCERIGISFTEYLIRFTAAPAKLLDTEKDAPVDYHDRTTVAKTFALAIDEAAKLHPASEPLIVYAALLAAEPIPLYLFSEARERLGDPLTSLLVDDGLDEAVAALRAFALVDRESVPDERDPSLSADCIRLHRLVREVAAARRDVETINIARCRLIEAMALFYPDSLHNDPLSWPRARRLDPLAMSLVAAHRNLPNGADAPAASVMNGLACYRVGALANYSAARSLLERALSIDETALDPNLPHTARSLNNLGYLLELQGDLAGALPHWERALAIREKTLGSDHPDTASSLNNLGRLLKALGDVAAARQHYERALAIRERTLGPDHSDTAQSLTSLGEVLEAQGNVVGARECYERSLVIQEKALGPSHYRTGLNLDNLGSLLLSQGDLAGARANFERALAARESALGSDHPDTGISFNNLGGIFLSQRKFAVARLNFQRALVIFEKAFGVTHPRTQTIARNLAVALQSLGYMQQVKALRKKHGIGK